MLKDIHFYQLCFVLNRPATILGKEVTLNLRLPLCALKTLINRLVSKYAGISYVIYYIFNSYFLHLLHVLLDAKFLTRDVKFLTLRTSDIWLSDVRNWDVRCPMSEVWCSMCMDALDMERLTSDIRKVTSDIRRLTSDIGHQKSDIRHRTSGIRCLTLVIRRLTSDIRLQTSHVWHLTSDLRCVTSDITHRTTLYWLINLCCLLSFPKYQYISCQPWSEACMILAILPSCGISLLLVICF